ncbi:MAG: fasciclin [Ferruginibacter sp.]|nr:fasciclin [Ferruginibacter sp.]
MKKNLFSFMAITAASAIMTVSCSDNASKTTETTMSDTSMTKMDDAKMDSKMTEEPGVMVGGAKMVASKNIVENAAGSADHTTLVAAVTAAGLGETLSGAGPFTVFAPTNAAFAALPAGAVDNLMKPAMKADLTKVLTYHVVPGALKAADLKDGQKLKTVQGQELTVSVKDGKVMINGANVTIADVVSSNGVTHVIDAVLMPKK